MSSRAELSTPWQNPGASNSGAASVALIGPDDSRRRVMAQALLNSDASFVQELNTYPADPSEIQHLVDQGHAVVMIDVDSDERHALEIVEALTAQGVVAMVYSGRNDPELLTRSMRAGAREFLPLPGADPVPPSEPGAQAAAKPIARPIPVPDPKEQAAAPATVPAAAPELKVPPAPEPIGPTPEPMQPAPPLSAAASIPAAAPAAAVEPPAAVGPSEPTAGAPASRPVPSESYAPRLQEAAARVHDPFAPRPRGPIAPVPEPFKADDALVAPPEPQPEPQPEPLSHPISAPLAAPPAPPESAPAPAMDAAPLEPAAASAPLAGDEPGPAVRDPRPAEDFSEWDRTWVLSAMPGAQADPVKSKTEPRQKPRKGAEESPETNPAEERLLFVPAEDDVAAKPKTNNTLLIVVLVLLLLAAGAGLMYLLRSSHHAVPAARATPVEYVVPQTETVAASATQPPPAAPQSEAASPAPDQAQTHAAPEPQTKMQAPPHAPSVSAEEMNAQLAAPARISSSIKQPVVNGEAPGGLVPTAMESGGAAPVFAGGAKTKVVPAITAISAGVAAGMLIHKTSPVYPPIAQQARVGGTVVVRATITRNGSLADLRVMSGPPMLVHAALEAVKTWRYRPYLLNNEPVEVETTIDVIFNPQ